MRVNLFTIIIIEICFCTFSGNPLIIDKPRWELIEYDLQDHVIKEITSLSSHEIQKQYLLPIIQVLEIYSIKILGEFYKVINGVINVNDKVTLVEVDIERHEREDESSSKIYLVKELLSIYDISLHHSFYIPIQLTIIEMFLQKNIIFNYSERIILYEKDYFVVYAWSGNGFYIIFGQKKEKDQFHIINSVKVDKEKPYL